MAGQCLKKPKHLIVSPSSRHELSDIIFYLCTPGLGVESIHPSLLQSLGESREGEFRSPIRFASSFCFNLSEYIIATSYTSFNFPRLQIRTNTVITSIKTNLNSLYLKLISLVSMFLEGSQLIRK